jgi:hypothetical protein
MMQHIHYRDRVHLVKEMPEEDATPVLGQVAVVVELAQPVRQQLVVVVVMVASVS